VPKPTSFVDGVEAAAVQCLRTDSLVLYLSSSVHGWVELGLVQPVAATLPGIPSLWEIASASSPP
jgi:hypothetical protein